MYKDEALCSENSFNFTKLEFISFLVRILLLLRDDYNLKLYFRDEIFLANYNQAFNFVFHLFIC